MRKTALLLSGLALMLLVVGAGVALLVVSQEQACTICDAAEAGDLSSVRAGLEALTDAEDRSAMATQALDQATMGLARYPRDPDRRALVMALLEAGADPDASVSMGASRGSRRVEHIAERIAELGDGELFERFVAKGLDVKGRPGGAALAAAASAGRIEVAERLVELGADVNAPHEEFGSPLAAAIHGRHHKVIALLDSRGAKEW